MSLMRVVAACCFLIAGCALCSGQDAAMLRADRAFMEAVQHPGRTAAGRAALDRLLDSDFIWTDFEGKSQTKSEIATIPSLRINSADKPSIISYTYGNLGDVQENYGRLHLLRVWARRPKGWKAMVYQEVMSLEAPPSFAPGAGKDCENPCKAVPYQPKNTTEGDVISAYSKLETAAMAHNSAVFSTLVADEFVAASSNSNKLYDKIGRMNDFDHAKMAGVAPTPLISAHLFDFGDAVLMRSEHQPDRGKPLHVTRVWVKRNGSWMETLSYQTSVAAAH
jgi:hypothetical protein